MEIAQKKAEEYNRLYHGIFIHSLYWTEENVNDLVNLKQSGKKAEICVSTIRSNSVYRDENNSIVIVGFGKIKELYDFDAYTKQLSDGSRIATSPRLKDERLHGIDKDFNGYDETHHYDEGIMDFNTAEVVFASVPKTTNQEWIGRGTPPPSNSQKYVNIVKTLKQLNPNIKIISPQEFGRIKSIKELLNLTYKLKEEQGDKELMKEPLHKYEEGISSIKFKEYFTFI